MADRMEGMREAAERLALRLGSAGPLAVRLAFESSHNVTDGAFRGGLPYSRKKVTELRDELNAFLAATEQERMKETG